MSDDLPASSFYLLPTRAWELLLGGALCLWAGAQQLRPMAASAMGVIGLAMIAASLYVLTPYTSYPGYAALLPTVGSALVLLYGRATPVPGALLTLPALRRIGDFSYSAYLWHWPLIVYYRVYIGGRSFNGTETSVLAIASLAAGYLSWRFIERPVRQRAMPPRRVAGIAVACSCAVAAAALFTAWTRGLPQRVDPDVAHLTNVEAMRTWTCPQTVRAFVQGEVTFCIVGAEWARAGTRGVVWGDSHADAWAPVLDRAARRAGISLMIASTHCAPHVDNAVVRVAMPGAPRFPDACTRRNRAVRAWLDANTDVRVVILAASWSSRMRDLQPPHDD